MFVRTKVLRTLRGARPCDCESVRDIQQLCMSLCETSNRASKVVLRRRLLKGELLSLVCWVAKRGLERLLVDVALMRQVGGERGVLGGGRRRRRHHRRARARGDVFKGATAAGCGRSSMRGESAGWQKKVSWREKGRLAGKGPVGGKRAD
eukprot:5065288-Pleurochrysis_carterae.AAC.1